MRTMTDRDVQESARATTDRTLLSILYTLVMMDMADGQVQITREQALRIIAKAWSRKAAEEDIAAVVAEMERQVNAFFDDVQDRLAGARIT